MFQLFYTSKLRLCYQEEICIDCPLGRNLGVRISESVIRSSEVSAIWRSLSTVNYLVPRQAHAYTRQCWLRRILYYGHASNHPCCFISLAHARLPILAVLLPIISEFCTLCICFTYLYLWSLPLSYPCTLFISGSHLSLYYIADCQAASAVRTFLSS